MFNFSFKNSVPHISEEDVEKSVDIKRHSYGYKDAFVNVMHSGSIFRKTNDFEFQDAVFRSYSNDKWNSCEKMIEQMDDKFDKLESELDYCIQDAKDLAVNAFINSSVALEKFERVCVDVRRIINEMKEGGSSVLCIVHNLRLYFYGYLCEYMYGMEGLREYIKVEGSLMVNSVKSLFEKKSLKTHFLMERIKIENENQLNQAMVYIGSRVGRRDTKTIGKNLGMIKEVNKRKIMTIRVFLLLFFILLLIACIGSIFYYVRMMVVDRKIVVRDLNEEFIICADESCGMEKVLSGYKRSDEGLKECCVKNDCSKCFKMERKVMEEDLNFLEFPTFEDIDITKFGDDIKSVKDIIVWGIKDVLRMLGIIYTLIIVLLVLIALYIIYKLYKWISYVYKIVKVSKSYFSRKKMREINEDNDD